MNRQAWRDFFITLFLLGIAFVLAMLSSVAAEQQQGEMAAIAAAVSLILALLGALYIIPRLARNVRLEILRFAIRTTVTVEGLLFVVFLAVLAFAAWNTGNNLLYLILSAMMAFLVAANLIARISLADISVQLRFPDHIFAGESANLTVTLINHKRLMPSYSLTIEALSDKPEEEDKNQSPPSLNGLGKLSYFMLTPARANVRQRIQHNFNRRGRYPITGFRIATKFPAGFFKKWRRIDANGEIIVYPKPKPLDDFYHALPMLAGQIRSLARGSGDDLYAIRRYHPSDHMRKIDWKATAKAMEMMVRDHTREDEWRLTIVFDTARPPGSKSSHAESRLRDEESAGEDPDRPDGQEGDDLDEFEKGFERGILMAASLANHFILERADVELITPSLEHTVASGSGYEHLYKILRALATLHPAQQSADSAAEGKPRARKRYLADLLRRFTFGRAAGPADAESANRDATSRAVKSNASIAWRLLDDVPVLADERRFKVLITSAAKGTIPAHVWRSAHVVFIEDL